MFVVWLPEPLYRFTEFDPTGYEITRTTRRVKRVEPIFLEFTRAVVSLLVNLFVKCEEPTRVVRDEVVESVDRGFGSEVSRPVFPPEDQFL